VVGWYTYFETQYSFRRMYFKAKESYHARCVEYEKMKRENASPKDLDKIEAKYKKASEFLCFSYYRTEV